MYGNVYARVAIPCGEILINYSRKNSRSPSNPKLGLKTRVLFKNFFEKPEKHEKLLRETLKN